MQTTLKTTCVHCSVCACGKWVCTGEKCPDKKHQSQPTESRSNSVVEEDTEEDEDIEGGEYDEEEPEDDPDVQDINWF